MEDRGQEENTIVFLSQIRRTNIGAFFKALITFSTFRSSRLNISLKERRKRWLFALGRLVLLWLNNDNNRLVAVIFLAPLKSGMQISLV